MRLSAFHRWIRPLWPPGWTAVLIVVALAFGSFGGLLAGYLRWSLQLRIAAQQASPPSVTALRDAQPSAVVDLMQPEGTALVQGTWRYTETQNPPVRRDGITVFPRLGWRDLQPGDLGSFRRTGARFRWYRIDVTMPERIAEIDARGSTVLLELAIDGYAHAWIDGKQTPVLGQHGATLIAGWNRKNRLIVTRDAHPGQRLQVTVVGVNDVLSDAQAEVFAMRSATLDFVPTASMAVRRFGEVVRLDPALNAIIPGGAQLEKVFRTHSGEGPVWMPQGYLLFSDIFANQIDRWADDDGLSVFRTKSGYAGFDISEWLMPGSNGLAVDREGRLTIAEHGRRRVVRLERDGEVTVLADAYGGRRLNSPNDLVYKSDGTLYFTDPPAGLPRNRLDRRRELSHNSVYRVQGRRLELLTSELTAPNGIAFSPDERYLYIADSPNDVLVRFDVLDAGTIASPRRFFPIKADGLKVDEQGNVYAATGDGGVSIISAAGKRLGIIRSPEYTSNIAWGGHDRRTLYLVGGRSVFRIHLDVAGAGAWRSR